MRVTHLGIHGPRAKAAKKLGRGGNNPPFPRAGFLPHAAKSRRQLQDSLCLWVGGEGGTQWVTPRHRGTQGGERGGGIGPPAGCSQQRAAKGKFQPKRQFFAPARSGVSSRPPPQPWKASLQGLGTWPQGAGGDGALPATLPDPPAGQDPQGRGLGASNPPRPNPAFCF